MHDDIVWPREYIAEFCETERDLNLARLADQYHIETEQYDQMRCTGRTERGIAMPATLDQRMDITRNALATRDRLGVEAIKLGFSVTEWDHAVGKAGGRFDRNWIKRL